MQVEIKIDSSCTEPRLIVVTDRMTDEIHDMLRRLAAATPQMIAGLRDDTVCVLEQSDIIRIYTTAGKVFAETQDGEYALRLRLYELADRLDKNTFVRISNSEIVNIRRVKSFDLSFAGTICVRLSNGAATYVSRRYVTKIKTVLGI